MCESSCMSMRACVGGGRQLLMGDCVFRGIFVSVLQCVVLFVSVVIE